jgi:pilus assembly protein Flp/PilA
MKPRVFAARKSAGRLLLLNLSYATVNGIFGGNTRMRAQAMVQTKAFIGSFIADQRAATAIEYTLIAGGIALVIIATVTTIGNQLRDNYFGPMTNGLK